MSTTELLKEIKSLPEIELQAFLTKLLMDMELKEEIERLCFLKLTEQAFDFWNDPREDVYQDYSRMK